MPSSPRPNVLVLISDDTDPAYLGPYGGPYPTPHLDWLAREGVRLARHEVVAPICTPSRYAYLTGRWPSLSSRHIHAPREERDEFRLVGFEVEMRPGDEHAATVFRRNGYTTGYVGKYHCGRYAEELGMGQLTAETPPAEADHIRRRNQDIAVEELHRLGWDYAAHIAWGNIDWEPWHRIGVHNPEWTTEGAVRFLREQKGAAQPFFLVVATNLIHGPKHAANIVEEDPLLTPAGRLESAPQTAHPSRQSVIDRLKQAGHSPTHRAVGAVWLDDCLGVLRQELEAIGQLDNTLIVYQTDHSVYGKSSCHVTGSRTGFLARWPGRIPAGTVCAHTVQNLDFLPTLVELLGLEKPPEGSLHGRSYAAALRGQPYKPPGVWFNESGIARSVQTIEFKYIAVRYQRRQVDIMQADEPRRVMNQIGQWVPWMPEYYHRHYWEADQLYRIDHDELEQINLAAFPRYAGVLADLKRRLRDHLHALGQSFPEEPPAFQLSDDYRQRVQARMATSIDTLEYFHDGGW